MPTELSFAEATAIVGSASQQVLIGWSTWHGMQVETPRTLQRAASSRSSFVESLRSEQVDLRGSRRTSVQLFQPEDTFEWVVNPDDKLGRRMWTFRDRLVVIKHA